MKILMILFYFIFILSLSARKIKVPVEYPTIQSAINASVDNDTITVQPGTYFENIHFAGKSILVTSFYYLTQDTTYISQTIINGNGDNHVVEFSSEEDSTAILSGFTITNGFAFCGGGIYCEGSSPKLENLTITDNTISGEWMHYGGGIYMDESSPVLKNLTIRNNTAAGTSRSRGGGIYCCESTPMLFNVVIEDNEVFGGLWAFGGGIACDSDSYMYLYNVTIRNNKIWDGAWNYGGGLHIDNSSAELYNVVVTDNSVWGESFKNGAGIYCSGSSLNIINSTIVNNHVIDGTINESGGIYSSFSPQPNLLNCILWNNAPQSILCYSDTAIVTYSNIQGGWVGEGNIDVDPIFVDIANNDLHLTANSLCIDAGDPNSPLDPDGTIADMGAYYFDQSTVAEEYLIQAAVFSLTNYPNPFNPSTTIEFSIQNDSNVDISIYNIKGQNIKTVTDNNFDKGNYSVNWNGDDKSGKQVSSGIYFYKLNVNGKTEAVKKCLLLK